MVKRLPTITPRMIPKKAPNKDAAYHYLNSFLDPKAVGLFCEASMYAPSITNVVMTDALKAKIDFTPDQRGVTEPVVAAIG